MDTQLSSPLLEHYGSFSGSSLYDTPPDHSILQNELTQNHTPQDSQENYSNQQQYEQPQKIEIEEEGRQDQNFEEAQDSKPLLENDKWEHYSSHSEPEPETNEEQKQTEPENSAPEANNHQQQQIEEEVHLILQEISALMFAIYQHLDGTKGQEDARKTIITFANHIRDYVQEKFSEVKSQYQDHSALEAGIIMEEICALIFSIYLHRCETKGSIEALDELRYIRDCFRTRQQKICSKFPNQEKDITQEKAPEIVEPSENIPAENIQISGKKELSYDSSGNSIETKDKFSEQRDNQEREVRSNFEQKPPPPQRNSNSGLRNLGNTCFMNALFRCLFDIDPFREAIIKIKEHKTFPLISKFYIKNSL